MIESTYKLGMLFRAYVLNQDYIWGCFSQSQNTWIRLNVGGVEFSPHLQSYFPSPLLWALPV